MPRSKYNVTSNKDKRSFNGITFDSELEMRFYKDVIIPKYEDGTIKKYELQKEYILQPEYIHDDKKIRPIKYVADFYIEYANGKIEVVDTKGMPDNVALIKRKMMWYLFPTLDFKWLSYVKKYGGWIEYDDLKRLRKQSKLDKKKKEKNKDGKD